MKKFFYLFLLLLAGFSVFAYGISTNLHPDAQRFAMKARGASGFESADLGESETAERRHFWNDPFFRFIAAAIGVLFIYVSIHSIIVAKRQTKFALNMMRNYQMELERTMQELAEAKQRQERLLLNILPKKIADELEGNLERRIARDHDGVAILFADIVGFTEMADSMDAASVVILLNDLIYRFDERALREGIEKIKTIGDCYMAAAGLTGGGEGQAVKLMRFAEGMLDDVQDFNRHSETKVQIRIGMNSGRVTAGIIGKSKFFYDVWGDTVNVASRIEGAGVPGKICVTETTYNILKNDFSFSGPFEVNLKGKGKMNAYLAEHKNAEHKNAMRHDNEMFQHLS